MYLSENTSDTLSMPDHKWAVEEVFHSMTELIFPGAERVGRAPSPAAFDFAFGKAERWNRTL